MFGQTGMRSDCLCGPTSLSPDRITEKNFRLSSERALKAAALVVPIPVLEGWSGSRTPSLDQIARQPFEGDSRHCRRPQALCRLEATRLYFRREWQSRF